MEENFTHLSPDGKFNMVDISGKKVSKRIAVALAEVVVSENVVALIQKNSVPKGNIFSVATISGIMGAKKTSELIPLSHLLPINKINVEITILDSKLIILCAASTEAKTGVEMEALTGATIAALTIYDMCKSVDKNIKIQEVQLLYKTGGKSGEIKGEEFEKYKEQIQKIINS